MEGFSYKYLNSQINLSFSFFEDDKFNIFNENKSNFLCLGLLKNNSYSIAYEGAPIIFMVIDKQILTIIENEYYYLDYDYGIQLKKYNPPKTYENENSEYLGSFLDEGIYGCIFKINNETISKISSINEISKEFQNIKSLPQPGPYYDSSNIQIIKLDSPENIDFVRQNCGLRDDIELYELRLPFIKGKTLQEYLFLDGSKNSFILKDIKHNYVFRIFPFCYGIRNWLNLLEALLEVYHFVKNLNDIHYIYHNDLHNKNIIYDEETQKITVIDFGLMSIGTSKVKKYQEEDIFQLQKHFQNIILCGFFDFEIRQKLFEYRIIDNVSYISCNSFNFDDYLHKIKLMIS